MVSLAIIPLFFYASRKYGFGLPPEQTTWTVLLDSGRPGPLAHGVAAPAKGYGAILGMFERFGLFTPPPRSGGGNAPPRPVQELCAVLRRGRHRGPRHGTPLYGYQPDETLRGAVPFYTGRFLTEIETLPALEEAIGKAHTAFVVTRDKNGKIEEELLSTGRLSVLARQGMDATRSVVLFTTGRVP